MFNLLKLTVVPVPTYAPRVNSAPAGSVDAQLAKLSVMGPALFLLPAVNTAVLAVTSAPRTRSVTRGFVDARQERHCAMGFVLTSRPTSTTAVVAA